MRARAVRMHAHALTPLPPPPPRNRDGLPAGGPCRETGRGPPGPAAQSRGPAPPRPLAEKTGARRSPWPDRRASALGAPPAPPPGAAPFLPP